ncbi:MAG: spore maturation protein [Oscillospiraceae bacterium]|nr:spore maturation protein [Oscillospiraceae bacterium]
MSRLTALFVPCLLAVLALYALRKKVDVYHALCSGAADGLTTVMRILPPLVALLSAVYMFRASGAMELLSRLLAPVLERLGIPPETAVILLVRPLSGSGAMGVAAELMAQYGADSYIGRVAAVMMGCTETTFYTVAVYFGAAGIRRTRYAVPAALTADLVGFIAAAAAVRLFFGA